MGSSSKSSPRERKPAPPSGHSKSLTPQEWQQLETRLQILVEEQKKLGDYDANASKIRSIAEILLAVMRSVEAALAAVR